MLMALPMPSSSEISAWTAVSAVGGVVFDFLKVAGLAVDEAAAPACGLAGDFRGNECAKGIDDVGDARGFEGGGDVGAAYRWARRAWKWVGS